MAELKQTKGIGGVGIADVIITQNQLADLSRRDRELFMPYIGQTFANAACGLLQANTISRTVLAQMIADIASDYSDELLLRLATLGVLGIFRRNDKDAKTPDAVVVAGTVADANKEKPE